MGWCQLRINIDNRQADTLSESLMEAGAIAVTFTDATDHPLYEPKPGTTPLWPSTAVTALFNSQHEAQRVFVGLGDQFGLLALGAPAFEQLEDRVWEHAWRERYQPVDCGDGLWVGPDDFVADAPDACVVRIEPGLAFGTGGHATTALCLRWIASHVMSGVRIVDFGCGSGILGIAALLRGAQSVIAVDHEAQARTATLENAQRNGVHKKITTCATMAEMVEPVDGILANVLLNPLLELRDEFAARLRVGGWIVLSGVLADQTELLADAYGERFDQLQISTEGDWARLSACLKS